MQQRLVGTAASAFGALLVLYAIIRLFNINPEPIVLNTARFLGGGKMVEFNEALTAGLDETVRACSVDRVDTDGDGFREWLVFYQSDPIQPSNWRQPCPDKSPRFGSIYDNDRGEPAIIFPYALTPPLRDLLGEQGTRFETAEIVANRSDSDRPIEELLVYGRQGGVENQLTIFKFQQNTRAWDTPTNDPPRYPAIGAFVGNGGVSFNPTTKRVTVRDRGPFERSQLVIKNVYELHGEANNETYMSQPGAKTLHTPVESTIDFAFGPPSDIMNTEFPEKIVLAFYQSLDKSSDVNWKSEDFLAPANTDGTTGLAAKHLAEKKFGYFFTYPPDADFDRNTIDKLAVTQLQYFPEVEENPVTRTIEGTQPQKGRVSVQLKGASSNFATPLIVYEMLLVNGQWKINQRLQ